MTQSVFRGFSRSRPSRALIAPILLAAGLALAAPARAEPPAVYMQRVAKELVAASRTGSASAVAATFRSHGDIPTIGLYSLGSYARRLPVAERPNYFASMVNWISRYVASKKDEYSVSSFKIGGAEETKTGVFVNSSVTLRDGSTYDVRWYLVRRGPGFKVRDAEVATLIGPIWARDQLKELFEKHITENGGNPRALIAALNR